MLELTPLPTASKYIICISLAIILMIGSSVNLLVLHVLRKRKVIRKNTSLILTHLLASNLIGCLVETPLNTSIALASFHEATEMVYHWVVFLTLFSSCGSFLLIFIDRLDCITRPFDHRLSLKRSKVGLGIIWSTGTLGTTFLSVDSITNNQHKVLNVLSFACYASRFVLLILMSSAFIVGLLSYYRIYCYVRCHNKNARSSGISTTLRLRRRESSISKSFCGHVVLFALFYIPYMVNELVGKIFETTFMPLMMYVIWRVVLSFRHTLSTVVYCGTSQEVSKAVRQTLNMKNQLRNITTRSYRSTFHVDNETKRAFIPASPYQRSELKVDNSFCFLQEGKKYFYKNHRNGPSSSSARLHSSPNLNSVRIKTPVLPRSENGIGPIRCTLEQSSDTEHRQPMITVGAGGLGVDETKRTKSKSDTVNTPEHSEELLSNPVPNLRFRKETSV